MLAIMFMQRTLLPRSSSCSNPGKVLKSFLEALSLIGEVLWLSWRSCRGKRLVNVKLRNHNGEKGDSLRLNFTQLLEIFTSDAVRKNRMKCQFGLIKSSPRQDRPSSLHKSLMHIEKLFCVLAKLPREGSISWVRETPKRIFTFITYSWRQYEFPLSRLFNFYPFLSPLQSRAEIEKPITWTCLVVKWTSTCCSVIFRRRNFYAARLKVMKASSNLSVQRHPVNS